MIRRPLSPWTATGKAILLRLDLVPTMRKLAATELLRVCVSGMQLAGQASAEADIQRAVSSAVSLLSSALPSRSVSVRHRSVCGY